MTSINQKISTINKFKLSYLEGGNGPTLVFLHGVGLNADTYLPCLKYLAQNFHIIAIDLPFHGNSDSPDNIWYFEDFAILINKFLKEIGIKKFHIIGHSFGGGISLHIADTNPDAQKIVLIGSAGLKPDYSIIEGYFRFFILKNYNQIFTRNYGLSRLSRVKVFLNNFLKKIKSIKLILNTTEKAGLNSFKNFDKINNKTLLLWSTKDEMFPIQVGERFNSLLKNSRLIKINNFHDWILDNPKESSDLITSFLKE